MESFRAFLKYASKLGVPLLLWGETLEQVHDEEAIEARMARDPELAMEMMKLFRFFHRKPL